LPKYRSFSTVTEPRPERALVTVVPVGVTRVPVVGPLVASGLQTKLKCL
jgi:hypothetical protein